MERRKNEKCVFPSPAKTLRRLDLYENVSSKYHLTDVFSQAFYWEGQQAHLLLQTVFHGVVGPCRHPPVRHFQHSTLLFPQDSPKKDWIFTVFMLTFHLFHCLAWLRPFWTQSVILLFNDLGSPWPSSSSQSFYLTIQLGVGRGTHITRKKKKLTPVPCFHHRCVVLIDADETGRRN